MDWGRNRWGAGTPNRITALILTMVPLALLPSSVSAAVVFDRALRDLASTDSHGAYYSSTLNGFFTAPGWQCSSAFKLKDDGVVSSVDWWGVSSGPDDLFKITIHSSVDDMPGPALASTLINPQIVATPHYSWGRNGGDQIHFFSANLESPFDARGNTDYFISILKSGPSSVWAWMGRDRYTDPPIHAEGRQRALDGTPWFRVGTVAFVLHGVPTPEPSALALFAIGCAASGYRRRRLNIKLASSPA